MKRLVNSVRDSRFVMLGFLFPLLVWVFICIVMGIVPFGPYSLLVSDLEAGHIDGLTMFRRIIMEGDSLAYSWGQIQGSTPFASLGVGTLISTFNFLVCFMAEEQILTALTWIVILRIACCGGTFAFYLKKTFKRNDLSISIFAWCYALMAYLVIYYFHIIWLDQVMMLPLVLLGVEKILSNKKDYLYFTVTLILIFFMNFYMAYMSGVFAFIYFIYRYLTIQKSYEIKDFIGKLGGFLLSPVLALGCSSILLFPIFALMSDRDGLFNASNMSMNLRYEFSGLLSKLCIGSFDTILPGGLPFIYCGVVVVILMFFYFMSYSISYKEKLLTFFLGLFMFFSMTINPLYVAWHGFKPPVYFEGRFTYIISFLMIFIAYKGFSVFNTITMKQIHLIFGIISGAIILLNRQVYSYISDASLLYTVAFLILYYLLIVLIKQKIQYKRYALLLLAILVGAELGQNAMMVIKTIDEFTHFPLASTYYTSYQEIKKNTSEILDMDNAFYRIEKDTERSMNDGFGIGYPSIAHFDSIYNYEVKEVINQWGVQVGHNWIRYKGSTPITDLLMNIKYTMIQDDTYQSYEKIKQKEEVAFFKNPYAVSMGFMVADPIEGSVNADNPINLQEQIINKMVGKDEIYYLPLAINDEKRENVDIKEVVSETNDKQVEDLLVYYRQDDYQTGRINYEIIAACDGPCYAYVDQRNNANMSISIGEKEIDPEFESGSSIIYLGDFKAGEKLEISFQMLQKEFVIKEISFYNLDIVALKRASENLGEAALEVKSHSDTKIEGNITVTAQKPYLYTSIPYNKGWNLYVDGKQMDTQKVMNGFLGAKLSEGNHDICLEYIPYGFKLGVITSLIFGLMVIGKILKCCKENNQKINKKRT